MKIMPLILFFVTTGLFSQTLNLTMDWGNNKANFKVGSIEKITWESDGVENLKIEYSTDAGKSWKVIEEKFSASTGFYDWKIPNTPSIHCRVRISDTEDPQINSVTPRPNNYFAYYFAIYGENKWIASTSPTDLSLTNVSFSDEKNGIAWGNEVLIVTQDAGNTWEKKNNFNYTEVFFVNEDNGWATKTIYGDSTYILSTNDGGKTWETQFCLANIEYSDSLGEVITRITNIYMIDENNGRAAGFITTAKEVHYYFFLSTNDGSTWKEISRRTLYGNVGHGIKSFCFVDESFGWKEVHYDGHVFFGVTDDGGYSWLRKANWTYDPLTPDPWEFQGYHNGNYFYAQSKTNLWQIKSYDVQSYLLKFIADNNHWEQILSAENHKYGNIYFFDDKLGWIAGSVNYENHTNRKSFIIQTTDGGITWGLSNIKSVPDSPSYPPGINSFFSLDGKTCWAVGDNGTILKYEDKNVYNNISVKLSLESPLDNSVINIATSTFTEGQNYFINPITLEEPYTDLEKEANIFEGTRFSLDEGAIDEHIALDIRFKLAGFNNRIPIPFFMFWGIEVTGEESGVTSFEDFYKFNDGKKARICIPKTEQFLEVLKELEIDITEIDFAFLKGGDYITEGIEWELKAGVEGKPDSVCIYLDHFSQIVGGKNLVTLVEEKTNNLPAKFGLEQNYPNPFNPTTTISYTIQSSVIASGAKQSSQISPSGRNDNIVTLKIFDVLGKEVKTLVNKHQQAGNYEIGFDASNLSSGIYYYQLKSGSFVEAKKMILMK